MHRSGRRRRLATMSGSLVTVIMPAYNAGRFVADAVESVIAQTFLDWEMLIVDDGSTDRTAEIIAEYERRDRRIRVVTLEPNRGLANARNEGLDRARGDFIAFIDSDDVWLPEKITRQVAAMEQHRADISYTGYERRREGRQRGTLMVVPEQVSYRSMLGRNKIAASTAMVRRSTCGWARFPQVRGTEDHRYWLALLRDGSLRVIGVAQQLAVYRIHGSAVSANKLQQAGFAWKRLREEAGLGRFRALWYFTSYCCGSLTLRLKSSLHWNMGTKRG